MAVTDIPTQIRFRRGDLLSEFYKLSERWIRTGLNQSVKQMDLQGKLVLSKQS